ncbi:MAG: VOC family protein [Kiritimatiellaeota bacterium]|nr:VOC family protein [Kiritimatiellota bacterium]
MSEKLTGTGIEGFHHVALRTADFEAAVAFYRDGLGFAEKISWGEGDGRAVLLDAGNGNYVEIFAGGLAADEASGPFLHFALRTDDCDAALARAVAAGAEVTVPPKDVTIPSRPSTTPVRIAFCRAPAGELIEFFQNEAT